MAVNWKKRLTIYIKNYKIMPKKEYAINKANSKEKKSSLLAAYPGVCTSVCKPIRGAYLWKKINQN